MDVRWLTADEQELEAAIEELDEDSRPTIERQGSRLSGVIFVALFLYFGIAWFIFGQSIDADARPRVELRAVGELAIHMGLIVLGFYLLKKYGQRHLRKPPPREPQVRLWREHLTGLANDVPLEPVHRATFVSLITGDMRTASSTPRFAAPGVEFGNLRSRRFNQLRWHYLAVELPSPLPHLILESANAGRLPAELPRAEIGQAVSMGYPFDDSFTLYAPEGYEHDALYVLTPAVMALLLDHAADFHIETIGDTLVFFTPELADFSEPEPWLAIDALWLNAVPAIVARSERYRDERVPEQGFDRRLSSYQEALTTPGWTWEEPKRRVAKRGKRLAQRKRGPAWSHILPYGRDMIFYLLMNAVIFVAIGGFFYALITLWEAFGGG